MMFVPPWLSPAGADLYQQALEGRINSNDLELCIAEDVHGLKESDRIWLSEIVGNLRGDAEAVAAAREAMLGCSDPYLQMWANAQASAAAGGPEILSLRSFKEPLAKIKVELDLLAMIVFSNSPTEPTLPGRWLNLAIYSLAIVNVIAKRQDSFDASTEMYLQHIEELLGDESFIDMTRTILCSPPRGLLHE